MNWENVALLGIDVGYSAHDATTGIAQYQFKQELQLKAVRTGRKYRAAVLGSKSKFDAIAIDGPIIPPSSKALGHRLCEKVLGRKPFVRNCMAAPSHYGTGLLLRNAAMEVSGTVTVNLRKSTSPLVEAFPNAFLGVMLDQEVIDALRPIPRGKKSDLFYACAVKAGCFDRLFDHLGWHDERFKELAAVWAAPQTRIAHEYRAAIVCVLTAACALARKLDPNGAKLIGDETGGFICLPPIALWAKWAHAALGELSGAPLKR